MIQRTVGEMAKMMHVAEPERFADVAVKGVSIDSRKIDPGNLFVPFKGENSDGHRFVRAAIEAGAAAALWQRDVENPPSDLPIILVEDSLLALQELARSYRNELSLKVVGITGSNGKTTTKDMMANLLSTTYKVQKTEGNYNNHIGLPLTILRLAEDTEVAVLEMGMSARGEISFLTRLGRPDAVIITNIGESHLQDLGSREGIAAAKLEIIEGLKDNGLIVYNGDEPLLTGPLSDYKGTSRLESFGRNTNNTLYPVTMEQRSTGSVFTINESKETFELPVLGAHNVLNALAAMLVAREFGVPFAKMNEGFSRLKLTNMRMELLAGSVGEKVINDAYNASPTSMRAAVELVGSLEGYSKKVVILGDMLELGPDEVSFHQGIGADLNPETIDFVFTYGKLGAHIAEGALPKLGEKRVRAFMDKKELIEAVKEIRRDEHTLILVKASRGMRLEEVVEALQQ